MASKWLEVGQYGQSVWYDNVARPAVETGLLAKIMVEDGVTLLQAAPIAAPPNDRRIAPL